MEKIKHEKSFEIPFGASDSELIEETISVPEGYSARIEGDKLIISRTMGKENPKNPKFKVGDFIVNDYCMGRVIELTNDAYLLDTEQGIPFSCEYNVHLWSINDAKDGDIIYIKRYKNNSEWLLIFKKIKSQNNFIDVYDYYAFSTTTDNVYYSSVGCWGLLHDEDIVRPATKEQCNILLAKMKEAGYEWDAEKKVLKEIEPKFHEGDWVAYNSQSAVSPICQITKVDGDIIDLKGLQGERFHTEYWDLNENYHLWTIDDAKDGDVLAGKIDGDSYILIYRQIKDGWIETHGHYYDTIDRFCVPSQLFCRDCKGTFYPATKEQRDLLFSKMKEEGHEWDAEKKELRKIGQNFTDKVEPKFKVGDWVATSYGKVNQVVSVDKDGDGYTLDDGVYFSGSWCDMYHLWSIQDAKEGDVLVSELCGTIMLYKGIEDNNIQFYCDYDFSDIDVPGDRFAINNGQHYGSVDDSDDWHPATKEQRDLLFQKMKESRYEWDAEKKELKKLIKNNFNVGDYIIDNVGHILHIIEVLENLYHLENTDGGSLLPHIKWVDNNCRLWTIKDAKDGDVLYSKEHNLLWIYKDKEAYHACINLNHGIPSFLAGVIVIPNDTCPATKEQRDLLFAKMKEEGYGWDAEKKKVKIIDFGKHLKYTDKAPSLIEDGDFIEELAYKLQELLGGNAAGAKYLAKDWAKDLLPLVK